MSASISNLLPAQNSIVFQNNQTDATQPHANTVENKDEIKPADSQSQDDLQKIEQLKSRDVEVKSHEQAHLSAAGSLATGGASYTYAKGPNGVSYAVGGEVNIDTSPVKGDPAATLRKADTIRRAALAPANPSAQDQRVAAKAAAMAEKARADLSQLTQENNKTKVGEKIEKDNQMENSTTTKPDVTGELATEVGTFLDISA